MPGGTFAYGQGRLQVFPLSNDYFMNSAGQTLRHAQWQHTSREDVPAARVFMFSMRASAS